MWCLPTKPKFSESWYCLCPDAKIYASHEWCWPRCWNIDMYIWDCKTYIIEDLGCCFAEWGIRDQKAQNDHPFAENRAGELELSDECSNPQGPARALPKSLNHLSITRLYEDRSPAPLKTLSTCAQQVAIRWRTVFPVSGLGAVISRVWHLVSSNTGLEKGRRLRTATFRISPKGLLLSRVQAFYPCHREFFPKPEEKLDPQHSAPFSFICPYSSLLPRNPDRFLLVF